MQNVKVRKTGISAEQAADVLRQGLGQGYRVEPGSGEEVRVSKGIGRARVNFREEAGGTVFEVRSVAFTPLMALLSGGIAKRTAAAIDAAAEFRDDR